MDKAVAVKASEDLAAMEAALNNIPERTCRICNKPFPETKEYFYTHNSTRDGWDTRCKACVKKIVAPKKGTPGEQPKTNTQPVLEKACWVCGKHFPVTVKHFRRHGFTADGFENRCRACVGKNNILQIDFSGNMDLLDKLKTAAASEFRTPELQLMAMIAKEA